MLRRNKKSVEMAEISWRYWDVAIIFFLFLPPPLSWGLQFLWWIVKIVKTELWGMWLSLTQRCLGSRRCAAHLTLHCHTNTSIYYAGIHSRARRRAFGALTYIKICEGSKTTQASLVQSLYLSRQHTHTHTVLSYYKKRNFIFSLSRKICE